MDGSGTRMAGMSGPLMMNQESEFWKACVNRDVVGPPKKPFTQPPWAIDSDIVMGVDPEEMESMRLQRVRSVRAGSRAGSAGTTPSRATAWSRWSC